MILLYDDPRHRLLLLLTSTGAHEVLNSYPAANNVDSRSRGPWPQGVFPFRSHVRVRALDEGEPHGAYGPWFFAFDVVGREGMGIHAGREGDTDGLGREGHLHATMGCIRTTGEAMEDIAFWHRRGNPVEKLIVIRNDNGKGGPA